MALMEFTSRERRIVLLACCFSGFVTPLLSTMMNLSLVSIGHEFDVGSHHLAYVNTSFLLSSVLFMVPIARAADIWGKKKIFLIGLSAVLGASILAMFTPSFLWLVACRAIMGAGAAGLSVTSISMITDVFPKEMRGGAIGIQTMCVYIGSTAGPPIGGVLNDLLGWHMVFIVVVPLALMSILCMSMFKHEITPDAGDRFDSKGAILYGVGIVLTMGGVMNMPDLISTIEILVGLVFIVAFIKWQTTTTNYLLNVRLFRSRVFSGSCLAAFLNYGASYSISYFMALYLQSIGALTASEAGALMLVQAALQAVFTPLFGRVSDKIPDKRILPTVGMVLTGVGVAMFLLYSTELDLHLVIATMVSVGIGMGMFSAPNTSVIMGSVPKNETSEASGMVAIMRQTGMMLSMGIAMTFIKMVMGSMDNLNPSTYDSFIQVIHYSFAACLVMCAIGVFASFMRGKGEGN